MILTLIATMIFDSVPTWHGLSADNWIKIVAVVIGGTWTVMNFVRQRTYRKRLDVDLAGSFTERDEVILFSGDCKAENLGSSEVPVLAEGTGIYVFSLWLRRYTDGGWGVAEELIDTLPVVQSDAWIEPAETLRKVYILPVPESRGDFVGIRSEAQINNGKTMWTVSQICHYRPPDVAAKSSDWENNDA